MSWSVLHSIRELPIWVKPLRALLKTNCKLISDVSLVVQIALVLAVIVAAISTTHYNRTSNHKYGVVSSMELIFKLSERIYDSERGKWIIEKAKDPAYAIVVIDEPEKHPTHREVENFLNDVETTFLLKQGGILTDDTFKRTFSWVVDLVVENKSIMDFIKAKQKVYGDVAWKPISDYYHQRELDSKGNS